MSQNQPSHSASVEGPEPSAGSATVPIWLIMAMGALLFWGAVYLDDHAGSFDRQVFEPFTSHAEIESLQPYDPNRAFLAEGEDVFNKTCAACHQSSGLGKEGQFPPLAGSDWLNAAGPNRIVRIVLNGLGGSIRVEGGPNGPVTLNATMVRPGDYNDEQVGAVLTYVRQQWGNHAAKITPEQVKTIREAIKTHPHPFTPEELLGIPVQ